MLHRPATGSSLISFVSDFVTLFAKIAGQTALRPDPDAFLSRLVPPIGRYHYMLSDQKA
jgi:hypothetical protein